MFQFIVGMVSLFSSSVGKGLKKAACFIAGTMVLVASRLVAIEDIKAGDKVVTTNPETGETAEKTVVETYIREVTTLVHLTINGESITTTVDHPFYVPERCWVEAGELVVGDKLQLVSGEVVPVEDIKLELAESPVTVYNFQVEDFHTYYVGNSGVLVHNAENYGTFPSSRGELDTQLKEKGFELKSKTKGGYDLYKNAAGEEVWIRPDGEVIRCIKEPIPNAGPNDKQFYNRRYQWNGEPVPNDGHNTGQFVESN